jgi:hypothetical protein
VSSDGSARVIESSTASTTSIAEDILSLSSSLSGGGGGGGDGDDVVATPVIVVGFFRPGHGIHHWPKNSLIKVATVSKRAYLADEQFEPENNEHKDHALNVDQYILDA